MLGRLALCAAAIIMLAVSFAPTEASARGFGVASAHHTGVFRWAARHRHHHYHRRDRNDAGYGYWPVGFGDGLYPPQEVAVPVAYPVYVAPRCEHSVQIVVVPAEGGGERRIRITRC